jgi:hypothetical protein
LFTKIAFEGFVLNIKALTSIESKALDVPGGNAKISRGE